AVDDRRAGRRAGGAERVQRVEHAGELERGTRDVARVLRVERHLEQVLRNHDGRGLRQDGPCPGHPSGGYELGRLSARPREPAPDELAVEAGPGALAHAQSSVRASSATSASCTASSTPTWSAVASPSRPSRPPSAA